jgi:hypothetical protein
MMSVKRESTIDFKGMRVYIGKAFIESINRFEAGATVKGKR